MRFAIETTTTRGPLTGIGQYVHRLTEAILPQLAPGEELLGFDGLSCSPITSASVEARQAQNDAISETGGAGGGRRTAHAAYLSLRGAAPVRRAARMLKQIAYQASERKFDVFHAVQIIPPGPFRKAVLPVIHDLSHIRFPESHPAERVRWLEKRLKLSLERVPFIQTVSQFSKREIVDLLGIDPARIHVSYPGTAPSMSPAPTSDEAIRRMKRYGVKTDQYFLMVSTREPRKNFKTATEAYARLPAPVRQRFPLLWIGHRGWGDLDLSAAVEGLINQGQIRIAGYVPDRDLPDLFRHSRLFILSSRYEGFGMPITEALTCGARIAVSDIPVFREVAGRFASYVDPLDIDGWRDIMKEAADGRDERPDPSALTSWLKRYTWSANASQTLGLYRRLATGDF